MDWTDWESCLGFSQDWSTEPEKSWKMDLKWMQLLDPRAQGICWGSASNVVKDLWSGSCQKCDRTDITFCS